MEKNREPVERSRSEKIYHYYKGTIQDETSKDIIRHLGIALNEADSTLSVYPAKSKRAAVVIYSRDDTDFLPVEGYSPLQMIAEVVKRCVKVGGYCSVPDSAARDKTLSLKAKGLYLLIESCLKNPEFDRRHFRQAIFDSCKESDKAFDSAWKELKEAGYLKQCRLSLKDGGMNTFSYLYKLLDSPESTTQPPQEAKHEEGGK